MKPSVTRPRESETSHSIHSPLRLAIVLALSIFICEGLIMLDLPLLSSFSRWFRDFLDPAVLLIVLSPAIYLIVIRPMVSQINRQKATQDKLRHLNSILLAIRNVNQLITREKDPEKLIQSACKILIEGHGFNTAWIVILDESQVVQMIAEAGLGEHFRSFAELLKQGKLTNCGMEAIKQSGVVVTEDPISICAGCPLTGNYSGSWGMTIRLEHAGKVYGLMGLSVPRDSRGYEEEKSLFQEVAGDIAFALYTLKLEEKRKETEKILRHTTERYSALVEESFDGIFVHKGPKIIFANRRLHEMLGYDEGDLEGLDHWLVYHPEYQKLTRERALARMRGEETITHYEVKMQRKDGSWFYAEIGVRVISIEGEQVIQVWIKDISKRREAEESLKRSEDRLKTILQSLPLGIGLVRDRQLLWHNETTSRMLGYSSKELQGKNTRVFYPDDEEFNRVGEAITALGPDKKTNDIEARWVRRDGSVFDCRIRHALLDPESRYGTVVAMVEDITDQKKSEEEKKKLEAQFNQAQKMEAIGTLAGGIAHDFNNLLTAIIGNADFIMDLSKNSSINGPAEQIRKAGRRAAALTRQLLAFSRKELIQPKVLDLNSLMMDLEKMLSRVIGEDIELVTAYTSDPCRVEADPGQMEQLVMNLAVNARDAMPKGGKLIFETGNVELDEEYFRVRGVEGKTGPYVMLSVTDSGTGMDEETKAHIFEPFFTTKEMGKGTGLGLSTVYGIVKQNKGHVWVYSEPGKGTTFKAYFHKAEADAESAKPKLPDFGSLEGSETILVVEDDESLRKLAERMLKAYGYKVLLARNGEEALQFAHTHGGSIDLMLTDVVMPGMSGPDLAQQLESSAPEIKVVYMSGYTDNAIAEHGVLAKHVNFIQKPFTREGLAKKVRDVLDRAK